MTDSAGSTPMSLGEFIDTCEVNGYERWSISRTQERAASPDAGRLTESYNVSIEGMFSISVTEHTLGDAMLAVLRVVEAVHGVNDPHRIIGAAGGPSQGMRPRGAVS